MSTLGRCRVGVNMKIEHSTARKFIITEIKGFDPISVYLEDFKSGQGQITIKCYNQIWMVGFILMIF